MPRGSLVGQISDLQIEWATHHAHLSVRDYLINIKKMTDRQYRYLIGKSPLLEWTTRREEIQNAVSSAKIDAYVDKAAETHNQFLMAARLSTARIIKMLGLHMDEMTSTDLGNLTKALSNIQQVFLRAMGIPDDQGMAQVYEQIRANRLKSSVRGLSGSPSSGEKFDYEQILEIIEWRREIKAARKKMAAPAE